MPSGLRADPSLLMAATTERSAREIRREVSLKGLIRLAVALRVAAV